jgi:hypothetical protein
MMTLTDGTFFPPSCQCCSVGPRQRTRGSSPRSPAGACVLMQGFFCEFLPVCGPAGYLFQPASAMFQPASVTRAYLVPLAFGAP